jgi:pilus assembly protein CpaC
VAGGEIPIPVATGMGQTSVVYKQYGVVIEFNPVSDAEGNIESSIEVEVSEPDPRNSNQGFVAFTTNRTTTQVALKHNTPLVISGLLRQQRVKSMDGVPGLSKLPVLGGIFRTNEARNEETELLVVVTPRLVTADSPLNATGVQRAQLMLDENRPRVQKRLEE